MKVRGLGPMVLLVVAVGGVVAAALLLAPGGPPEEAGPDRRADAPAPRAAPSPDPLPDQAPATLGGVVHGESVSPGAWLALTGGKRERRVALDERGGFEFGEAPPGVRLEIWLGPDPDGARVSRLATGLFLAPGEHRRLELTAPDRPAVSGRVTGPEGRPLPGVRVAVLHPAVDWRTEVPVAAETGADGRFYVCFGEEAPDEPIRLVVDAVKDGFVLEERVVDPAETGDAMEVEVALAPGLRIAGRAFGPDGQPLPGMEVHLREMYDGDPLVRRPVEGRVETDAEGRFDDDAYRPGVYRLVLSGEADDREIAFVKDGVRAGDEAVEVRFPGFGALTVAFEDERTREPILPRFAEVWFIYGHTGEEEFFASWRSLSGQGETPVRDLPEGHYRVVADHPGYEYSESDLLFVPAGADLGLIRFALTPR